jgi:pimeloyl-ACP methyl ester carboxylesterase
MRRGLRPVLPFLVALAGLYLALCLLMFLTQRSQVYFPVHEQAAAGALPLRIDVRGARLKVWAIERAGREALLYFGGNAEDVGASIGRFAACLPRFSLYFVNYRGYGGSTGKPSEAALVADAVALYDRLRSRHSGISVVGRSLGSGVAAQLAARREVQRLVLVTPFDSLVNVARAHIRWLPVGFLMLDRFDSAGQAPAITAETLVVIADADEIIPRARSEALVRAFRTPPRVLELEGAGHNDLDLDPRYLDGIAGFLDD